MTIEQSLAAQKIASLLAQGFPKSSAVTQAARFVKSQGFSAKHSRQVAEQMADLL